MVRPGQSDPQPGRFSFSRRRIGIALVTMLAGGICFWAWQHIRHPDRVLRQGQESVRAGLVDEAWQALDDLESRGWDDHARLLRGQILFNTRDFAGALRKLDEIPESSALYLDAVQWIGRCFLEMRALPDAEQAFQHVLSQRPDAADAHRGLAAVYYDMGATPLAAEHCLAWAKLEPDDGAPHRFRGVMLYDGDQFADAVVEYQIALDRQLPPEQRDQVRVELARSHIKLHQYAEALAALEAVSSANQTMRFVEARTEALRGLSRGAEAIPELDRAIQERPDDAIALRLRALLHLDRGDAAKAVELLERAAAAAPKDYAVRIHLANAYLQLGKTDEAHAQREQSAQIEKAMIGLSELTRQLHQDHRNPAIHEQMAQFYAQLNMTEHARKSRQLAETLRLGDPKRP